MTKDEIKLMKVQAIVKAVDCGERLSKDDLLQLIFVIQDIVQEDEYE